MDEQRIQRLVELNHSHVWHPFTPMRQWRQKEPTIIEEGEGDWIRDVRGNWYLDGVSSIWCIVHGHKAGPIDDAIRDQLNKIAHTTMLGMANVPATELAAELARISPDGLSKVFYSDAGATATELAFKMAVGYWFHNGQPQRDTFLALGGAYHGDTTGSMSVGYSDLLHKPFRKMVFSVEFTDPPDVLHGAEHIPRYQPDPAANPRTWSIENKQHCEHVRRLGLEELDRRLSELGDRVAGVVVEPLIQGAAGMVHQPPGYLAGVRELCDKHDTLLVADEVATGFGRTGQWFACDNENVTPDLMALGKGLSGGYLPLAATLATDEVEQAFCGEIEEHRTLYHGHTFTGNPLASAAALASIRMFEDHDLLADVRRKAQLLADRLEPLRDREKFPHVADIRQRGLMVGIEMAEPGETPGKGYDPSRRLGKEVCNAAQPKGVIIRPLGNVVILMPPLSIEDENLELLARATVESIGEVAQTVG